MALTISNTTDNVNVFQAGFLTDKTYQYSLSVSEGALTLTIEGFDADSWVVITPSADNTFYVPAVKDGPAGLKRVVRFTFTETSGTKTTYIFSCQAV